MNEIKFYAPGKAQPQGSIRAFIPRGWKRPILTSDNPNLKAWRNTVAAIARTVAPSTPFTGAVEMTVCFELPRPKSLPKRVVHCTKKPDVDKCLRGILDALTGIIYADDSQVIYVAARKRYAVPERGPGVYVTVSTVD